MGAGSIRNAARPWREGARSIPTGRVPAQALAVFIFLLATAAAIAAQRAQLPLTAAILYLLGVTLVGGLAGIRGGLAGALAASLIYNFFISDPVFRFSLVSAEEYVPLIGFNLSAAASALLAGRLKERALAAETANLQLKALLDLSQRLQSAVHVDQIPAAIQAFVRSIGRTAPELYVVKDGEPVPVEGPGKGIELARELVASGVVRLALADSLALLLATGAGPVGALVLPQAPGSRARQRDQDLEAFVNVLSITLERCLLLEQLSEAELIKRSEEFKTALLSSVSHDMRTPLSAISASASSLASYELPAEVRGDLLATIREQCERLNRYTTNLLNLGRLQGGLDPKHFTECDAFEVLGTAISRARNVAGERGIVKCYRVDSALVRADPVMLEQVFYNVLENAVHYSPERSSIAVAADVEDGHLLIDILDEGPGIAPGDEERVFNRFYRAQPPSSHEGSGLGLSIARGFTEAFGGSIAARADDVCGGTRISIRLPLETRKGE
ncbi:MAG TPA: ATP-binding protein [Allosphingosinicella sp.]|nr:ATP-binding protein [Allosphingosinicella sp.]